jgi:hypothetical protein
MKWLPDTYKLKFGSNQPSISFHAMQDILILQVTQFKKTMYFVGILPFYLLPNLSEGPKPQLKNETKNPRAYSTMKGRIRRRQQPNFFMW